MTLELTATLVLIASHVVLTAIGFWIGWKLGKNTGYLEAEAEIAAIASEPREAVHDCRFFKAANGECMACLVLEKRKQSSPFTVAEPEEGEWIPWDKSECPVEAMTKVDVKFRDGGIVDGRWAQNWVWGHPNPSNDPNDITHYRLSK